VAGLIEDPEVREVLTFMAGVYDPTPSHFEGDRELLESKRDHLRQTRDRLQDKIDEGYGDADTADRIAEIEQRLDELDPDLPRSFWETKFAQRAIRKHGTRVAHDAIRDGNMSQAAYLVGDRSYQSDVSGLHAINQLAEWLVDSEACKLIYLAALMGRGKTDLSLTMCEIIADHFARVERAVSDEVSVPTPEFAANFHVETPSGDPDVEEINRYDRLVEWMERGTSQEVRWFIFDEASSELTAQNAANAQKVVERMGGLVKKMRKMGVNMIVIGHDKGDVHVAIRSLADFVDKSSLKKAQFYAGISNREPAGHLFSVDGIPPTSWDFDTDDTADWDWCDEEEEDMIEGITEEQFREWRDERIAQLRAMTDDEGNPLLGQSKVGSVFGLTQSAVSTIESRVEEIRSNGDVPQVPE
jgi:hypothetical protein